VPCRTTPAYRRRVAPGIIARETSDASISEVSSMHTDLHVWHDLHDLDADRAKVLVDRWVAAGADPARSPFEPSTDVAWFFRELSADLTDLDATSDAARREGRGPVWLATDDPPPARIVTVRLDPETDREALRTVFELAAKYDLVVFDARGPQIVRPLEVMGEHASATFWPRGAIQAFLAGAGGLAMAWVGWQIGIPVLSWILILVGGFLFVMAVLTFLHEGSRRLRRGGGRPGVPTS
jgi:hypothetical protein